MRINKKNIDKTNNNIGALEKHMSTVASLLKMCFVQQVEDNQNKSSNSGVCVTKNIESVRCHLDMTCAVDRALNNNDLSICL